jgi:hypothetical protein
MRLEGKTFGGQKVGFFSSVVDGKFSGERYVGNGKFRDRDCVLAIYRPTGQAQAAATLPAQSPWAGTIACVALASETAREWGASVFITGDKVDVRTGKPNEPGWLQMTGARKSDGALRLSGSGISGMKEYLGTTYQGEFDGRFSGERYTGSGKLGTRICTLTIARK